MRRKPRFKKKAKTTWFKNIFPNGVAILSIISVLVSFATLYYLYQQYNTSIKPDIVINDVNAAMISERYSTNGYIHYLLENDSIKRRNLIFNATTSGASFIISPAAEFNSLEFSLTNIGLGVAKNVKLSWSFDTFRMVKLFNDNLPTEFLDSVKFEKSTFIFLDKEGKNYYRDISEPKDFIINYILSVGSSKEYAKSKLPSLYLRLFSCYEILANCIQMKSNLSKEINGKFPPLHLKISYADIGNSIYSKHYLITFRNAGGNSSDFQIRSAIKIQFDEVED